MVKKANVVAPEYTREEVNSAGMQISSGKGKDRDYLILNNWRTSHNYPLNTFQATLRSKIVSLKIKDAIVSQRIKREESITSKLQRYSTMRLSQMQDIGGLRAIVASVSDVMKIRDSFRNSKTQHELYKIDDYISSPKTSGYRSIHLMFKYCNSRAPNYNDLRIEIQARTKLQHYWANAVETVGTFIKHSLKSSQGPDEWLKFFALCGEIFARKEKTASLKQYTAMNEADIIKQCSKLAHTLDAITTLRSFSIVTRHLTQKEKMEDPKKVNKKKKTHLIALDLEKKEVYVKSYFPSEVINANKEYAIVEKKIRDGAKMQAVLVSTDSIKALKRAYPSYFLDAQGFLRELNSLIDKGNQGIVSSEK